MKKTDRTSRRAFAKSLAAIAAVPLVTDVSSSAMPVAPVAPPLPQGTKPPSALAQALTDAAKARYGKHINPDDLPKLAQDLDGTLAAAERVGRVKLANGEEPAFTFTADIE
jgi:hypothetical protein